MLSNGDQEDRQMFYAEPSKNLSERLRYHSIQRDRNYAKHSPQLFVVFQQNKQLFSMACTKIWKDGSIANMF